MFQRNAYKKRYELVKDLEDLVGNIECDQGVSYSRKFEMLANGIKTIAKNEETDALRERITHLEGEVKLVQSRVRTLEKRPNR